MSDQPQPRRWTASTVITVIVLVAFADYFIFDVALPFALVVLGGVIVAAAILAGFTLACVLAYSVVFEIRLALKKKTKD